MNRTSRIVSRKIFVSVLYEHISNNTATHQDRLRIDLFEDPSRALEHMLYMARWFFSKDQSTSAATQDLVDVEYLKGLIVGWSNADKIVQAVNGHSTTFQFASMDPIDQAIFLSWGIEYLVHDTPFKVIINEMIEIAKRYGDEWSPGLINGIGHKVLHSLKESDS